MSTDIRISARESGLISSGWGNTWLSNCDKAPGFPSSVKEIPASSRGATGTSAFLSRRSRTIDPHLDLRQENGALLDRWWETQHSSRVRTCISGNFWTFLKPVKDLCDFQGYVAFLWKRCSVKGPPQACRGEFRILRGVVAGS